MFNSIAFVTVVKGLTELACTFTQQNATTNRELICSTSKVTQLKNLSLPRHELGAALGLLIARTHEGHISAQSSHQ